MTRETIFAYVKQTYRTVPDYPWEKYPDQAILRHHHHKKWYGAVLGVQHSKLGLPGEGEADVINLKCGPLMCSALREEAGILPGYHMNKEHWISVLLEGPYPEEELYKLIDLSFALTQ